MLVGGWLSGAADAYGEPVPVGVGVGGVPVGVGVGVGGVPVGVGVAGVPVRVGVLVPLGPGVCVAVVFVQRSTSFVTVARVTPVVKLTAALAIETLSPLQ